LHKAGLDVHQVVIKAIKATDAVH